MAQQELAMEKVMPKVVEVVLKVVGGCCAERDRGAEGDGGCAEVVSVKRIRAQQGKREENKRTAG